MYSSIVSWGRGEAGLPSRPTPTGPVVGGTGVSETVPEQGAARPGLAVGILASGLCYFLLENLAETSRFGGRASSADSNLKSFEAVVRQVIF